jgi:hypothetical protein
MQLFICLIITGKWYNLTKDLNNDHIPARINSICSKEFGSHEDLSIEFENYLAGLQTNEEL